MEEVSRFVFVGTLFGKHGSHLAAAWCSRCGARVGTLVRAPVEKHELTHTILAAQLVHTGACVAKDESGPRALDVTPPRDVARAVRSSSRGRA